MGLIEDARTMLEAGEPTGEMDQCLYCGQYGTHDTGWKIGHDPDCCWPSMPRIVAALEAAGRTLNSNVQVVRTWYDEYNGWKMSCGSCLRTIPKGGLLTSEFPHKPDCPWQALVAAMRA